MTTFTFQIWFPMSKYNFFFKAQTLILFPLLYIFWLISRWWQQHIIHFMPKYSFASFAGYRCQNVAFVFNKSVFNTNVLQKSSYLSKRVELRGVGKRRNHLLLQKSSRYTSHLLQQNKQAELDLGIIGNILYISSHKSNCSLCRNNACTDSAQLLSF